MATRARSAGAGTGRRPGRPPGGSADGRAAVLAAARRQFAELGYDRTTVRGVAAEAGVDARLVTHHFGSKQRLFLAVVEPPFEPREVLPGLLRDAEDPAAALAGFLAGMLSSAEYRALATGLIRAATSEPEAAVAAREFLTSRLLLPLTETLGADQPELRASLLGAQIAGLVLARYVIELEPLASTEPEEIARILVPVVRRYLVEPL